jgi:rhamnogalacturonyl hydrolase YesR
MTSLDDCGAMGAGILAVYETEPQQRYLNYLYKAADYILNEEFRLDDGVFCRDRPYKMTIWGDDLYMSVPFLARMGDLTKEDKYFNEAANQIILFNKYLWDPQVRLFFHCWYDDIQQNGVAHWSRCNGWMMMAQVELLDKLPTDHPKREELIKLLTRQIIGISRYQHETGLWHQLLDRNDTYLETSSTAMFTYGVAKAINEGWLDARYSDIAFRGWEGLSTKIRTDGQVEGICKGTGLNSTTHFYIIRPTPLNDIHGLGPVLLAGSEMLRLIDYLNAFEE